MRIVRWDMSVPPVVVVVVAIAVVVAAVTVVSKQKGTAANAAPESWPDETFIDLPGVGCGCRGRHSHSGIPEFDLHLGGVLRVEATTAHSIRFYRGRHGRLATVCDVDHLGDGCYVDGSRLVLNFYVESPGPHDRLLVPNGAPLLGDLDRDYAAILEARRDGDRDPFFALDDMHWSFEVW
jgi:hypothetical protein